MHLGFTDFLFWAAGLFGHIVLFAVILTRHRAKTFPFFSTLIAMDIVRTITLYYLALHGTKYHYRVTYTSFAILDLTLQFCVAYEVALQVFRPTGEWAPDVRKGFIIVVLASVLVAAGLTLLPPSLAKTWLAAILTRGNFFASVLMCELFLGMIALSVTAGLPWKPHAARIAQGLGFYSLISIVTDAGHNIFGMDRTSQISVDLSLMRMVTYLICVTYWIVILWLDEPAPRELPAKIRGQLIAVQRLVEYDLRRLRALRR
jgi:hypothetical protein